MRFLPFPGVFSGSGFWWHNLSVHQRRFHPITRIPALTKLARIRWFAGVEPEDTVQCRVLNWQHGALTTVVLSPLEHETGRELSRQFEQVANNFYIELLAKRLAQGCESVRWIQHWPARDGAPAPWAQDRFEHVHLRFAQGSSRTEGREMLSVAQALSGLELESSHGVET